MNKVMITRAGGYDPTLGRDHPANRDPTLEPAAGLPTPTLSATIDAEGRIAITHPQRPRVLVDVDGVLAAFVDGWLRLINTARGTSYASADVTDWDVCTALGITEGERGAAKRLIAECPGFAADLEVLPGAIDGVRQLQRIAEVYIVTSRWASHPTWTHDRDAWLRQHFDIRADRIIHTSAKQVCVGDFLVDDKTSMCETWQAAHPRGVAVQWETPHNRRDAWAGLSAGNWDELVAIVDGRFGR